MKCRVRPVEDGSEVWGVYDEVGRLLGAGSRDACRHFVELLQQPELAAEYSTELLADLFELWQSG